MMWESVGLKYCGVWHCMCACVCVCGGGWGGGGGGGGKRLLYLWYGSGVTVCCRVL